jgi:hypothetical protein
MSAVPPIATESLRRGNDEKGHERRFALQKTASLFAVEAPCRQSQTSNMRRDILPQA